MGFIRPDQFKNPLTTDDTAKPPETGSQTVTPNPATPPTDAAGQLAALLAAMVGKAQLDPAQVRAIVKDELAKLPPHAIEIKQGEQTTKLEGQFHNLFPMLVKLIGAGCGHIFLSGPPGSGKTTAAERAAEALGREIFVVPPVGDKFEILGFRDAAGQYQSTAVYRWATAKPGAILLLDEVDGGFAQALLALNAMMANGIACFPHEQIRIPAEHIVIANGNTWGGGADFDFTGRSKLDAAFLNRFPNKLVWDYDEKFERALSGNPDRARYIQAVRKSARKSGVKIIITPRDTIAYCRKRSAGMTHDEAIDTGFLATVKPDVRAKLTEGIEIPA
jgi:cobaltochelatase CobS